MKETISRRNPKKVCDRQFVRCNAGGYGRRPAALCVLPSDISLTVCKPLADDAYDASQQGQLNVSKVIEDIDKLVTRSSSLAESSRASYDQVVDVMHTAKRLRRRASSALKLVDDLDEVTVEEGDPEQQKTVTLGDAARAVETVEAQARMMIGKFLDEDERLTGLKARLRDERLQEVLDVVNVFVAPGTYQKIKRRPTAPPTSA
ncbi:hypothetical protein [Allomesorhizobium alhagi]|uniref:Uncharacterized protein n=1 Tax=Mesorhizobium alhagi CCNWXJ12-2 TaxID=1107882 RepID=H0HUH1_9HYPH|nr:hypothetical protein [Mesorhizobium alhagi]EHK55618.1 hypothetical protein MAXJ12_19063 [Mesorhizobium alhagi CCNWXJ12-2]